MDASVEIRELRRHEIEEAVAFGRPLGMEASADAVRWTVSLTARHDGELKGLALVAPDATGTLRVWVAVGESAADRGGLICRLMDKAMLKLRSIEAGACSMTVCGEDGEAMVSRTHWCVEGESGGGDEATKPLRGLDEVVAASGEDHGEAEAGEAKDEGADESADGATPEAGDGVDAAQAA